MHGGVREAQRSKWFKLTTKSLARLCFARVREDSLTARPEIGVNTHQYGARREDLEALQHCHQLEVTRDQPDSFRLPLGKRPFPVPNICKLVPVQPVVVDMLLVSDFSLEQKWHLIQCKYSALGKRSWLRLRLFPLASFPQCKPRHALSDRAARGRSPNSGAICLSMIFR